MNIEIPEEWGKKMWTLTRYEAGEMGLSYACKLAVRKWGHIIELVGLGETPQQAVIETQRIEADLKKRSAP